MPDGPNPVQNLFPECDVADIQQRTAPWLAWRRAGIGGSDVPIILGLSPYKDASIKRVVLDKLGLIPDPAEENGAMMRGRLLEPKARAMLAPRLGGVDIYTACVSRKDYPFARVSLDGYFSYGKEDLAYIIEIKCLRAELHALVEQIAAKKAPLHSLPCDLALQVQWQLYVTGAHACHFASFWQRTMKRDDNSGTLHRVTLYPEPALWSVYLLPAMMEFNRKLEILRRVGYGVGGVGMDQFHADYADIFGEDTERGNTR